MGTAAVAAAVVAADTIAIVRSLVASVRSLFSSVRPHLGVLLLVCPHGSLQLGQLLAQLGRATRAARTHVLQVLLKGIALLPAAAGQI